MVRTRLTADHDLVLLFDLALALAFAAGFAASLWMQRTRGVVRGSIRARLRLDRALRRGELVVHFQPQVRCLTGRPTASEALVRWEHPRRGLLLPGAFLPDVACRRTLRRLTDHVLRVALDQARRLHACGLPEHVAVNVPPEVLLDARFARRVAEALAAAGARPEWLTLELTEGALITEAALAGVVLGDLRRLGVRLSIDDFGTGAASIERLRRLPFDEVKIDRSFVLGIERDAADALIVRAIAGIGRTLGRRVVAEGVESAALAERVAAYGCDDAQGFHFARALSAGELEEWLAGAVAAADRAPSPRAAQSLPASRAASSAASS
jgi:EAL domain-containing protein (putative c-di-GMP-specific phosphodiesterase class I)